MAKTDFWLSWRGLVAIIAGVLFPFLVILVLTFTNVWPAAHDFLNSPSEVTVCPVAGRVAIC